MIFLQENTFSIFIFLSVYHLSIETCIQKNQTLGNLPRRYTAKDIQAFFSSLFPKSHSSLFIFFKPFIFALEYCQLMNTVVMVNSEGIQLYIYMYPFSPKLFCHPAHSTEPSYLCCIVGSCWLSILNIAVCTSIPNSLTIPLPHPFPPPSNHELGSLSLWVCFGFVSKLISATFV